MKYKIQYTVLALFLFFSLKFHAQEICLVDDVVATVTNCTPDSFSVILDFEIGDGNSSHFYVNGNGNQYGLFSYDDKPITLGPFVAGNNIPYEFVVIDSLDGNCNDFVVLGVVECESDCQFSDLVVEPYDCDSGMFYVDLDFEHNQDLNSSFELYIGGDLYNTNTYGELPLIEVGPISMTGNTIEIKIQDVVSDSCQISKVLEFPFCDDDECDINDVNVDFECDGDSVYVTVDFNHNQDSLDVFLLRGNGNIYGYYDYGSLPVVFQFSPMNGTFDELIIIDEDNQSCSAAVEIPSNPCQDSCGIYNLEVIVNDLHPDGSFDATINFQPAGVISDSFYVYSGNVLIGPFAYAHLPLNITDIPSRNLDYELIRVCDIQYSCCAEIEFMTSDCPPVCSITNVSAEVDFCFEDNMFIDINFDYENPEAARFEVVGNGKNYGTFFYSELPVRVTDDYEEGRTYDFIIKDKENPNCLNYFALENPICNSSDSCLIYNVNVAVDSCYTADSLLNIWVFVGHDYSNNDRYDLFLDNELYESGFFSEFPMRIEGLQTTNDVHLISVCLNDTPNGFCCEDFEFFEPDCYSSVDNPQSSFASMVYTMDTKILKVSTQKEAHLIVYNRWGQQLFDEMMTVGDYSYDMSFLPTDFYVASLTLDNGETIYLNFVVVN